MAILFLSALILGWASYYFVSIYHNKYRNTLYLALIGGAVLHIPAVLLLIYLQKDTPDFNWSINITGFGSVRIYGYTLEVAIALGIGILTAQPLISKRHGYFLWLCLIALWMMLFWSGARGAVISIMIAVLFSSIFCPRYALKAVTITVLSGLAGALLSLLIWLPDTESFGLMRIIASSGRETVDAFSSGRIEMWQDTLAFISARPFLGYGLFQVLDLLPPSLSESGTTIMVQRQVHNIILEVLLAFGFAGGGIVLFFMVKTWLRVVRNVTQSASSLHWPAFLAINTLLMHGMISGTYFHVHSVMYLALLFGVGLQKITK